MRGDNEEMTEPLVSIIMGVYNGQDTLKECINSIVAQTYQNWEFIICNDCSSDETLHILEEFQKKEDRIIILNNSKNLRLAASLNKCLQVAKGKYIARMDADDESLPDRLKKQVLFLEKHPEYDVVGCNRIVFDENGIRGIRINPEYPDKSILFKDTPFAHPTIMMKRSVYNALGGYSISRETMRAEDLELWFRFFEHGFRGYNLQEVLYKYREGKEELKKRTVVAGIQTAKVFWNGYKRLKFPYFKRIWAVKPIVAAVIPDFIMMKYYDRTMKRK